MPVLESAATFSTEFVAEMLMDALRKSEDGYFLTKHGPVLPRLPEHAGFFGTERLRAAIYWLLDNEMITVGKEGWNLVAIRLNDKWIPDDVIGDRVIIFASSLSELRRKNAIHAARRRAQRRAMTIWS